MPPTHDDPLTRFPTFKFPCCVIETPPVSFYNPTPVGVFFADFKMPIAKVTVIPTTAIPLPKQGAQPIESWDEAIILSVQTFTALVMLGMDVKKDIQDDNQARARIRPDSKKRIARRKRRISCGGHEDLNPHSMKAIDIFKTSQLLKRDFVVYMTPQKYNLQMACHKPQERRYDLKARFDR